MEFIITVAEPAVGFFMPTGHGDAAGHQAVLLVLYGASAHGHVGEKVNQALVVEG